MDPIKLAGHSRSAPGSPSGRHGHRHSRNGSLLVDLAHWLAKHPQRGYACLADTLSSRALLPSDANTPKPPRPRAVAAAYTVAAVIASLDCLGIALLGAGLLIWSRESLQAAETLQTLMVDVGIDEVAIVRLAIDILLPVAWAVSVLVAGCTITLMGLRMHHARVSLQLTGSPSSRRLLAGDPSWSDRAVPRMHTAASTAAVLFVYVASLLYVAIVAVSAVWMCGALAVLAVANIALAVSRRGAEAANDMLEASKTTIIHMDDDFNLTSQFQLLSAKPEMQRVRLLLQDADVFLSSVGVPVRDLAAQTDAGPVVEALRRPRDESCVRLGCVDLATIPIFQEGSCVCLPSIVYRTRMAARGSVAPLVLATVGASMMFAGVAVLLIRLAVMRTQSAHASTRKL